jgi:AcrR family transcriptional regulator
MKKIQERPGLSRDRILDAAHAIIESAGLAAFSIRQLGVELGCKPMSVYHYFEGKEELLDALADRVVDAVVGSARSTETLFDFARRYRRAALKQPATFLRLASRPRGAAPALYDHVLRLLEAQGWEGNELARRAEAFLCFLNGAVLGEIAARQRPTTSVDLRDWPRVAVALPALTSTWREEHLALALAPPPELEPRKKKKDKDKKKKR